MKTRDLHFFLVLHIKFHILEILDRSVKYTLLCTYILVDLGVLSELKTH